MSNYPFTVLKYLHNNFACFVSNNENKYEILDANRVPYIAKYNREIVNFLSVADENGCIKLFKTYPKLTLVKEIPAQKSCIYDLEWLNSNQIACGGGDQFVSIYDISTSQRLAILRGHTESVKSISSIPLNPFVLASGSRDGSILIFDIRCNKYQPTAEIVNELNIEADSCCIRAINNLQKAHFTENLSSNLNSRSILKSKLINFNSPLSPSNHNYQNNSNSHNSHNNHLNSNLKKSTPVACVLYQNDHLLVSAGVTDGFIKVWDTRKIYTNTAKKPHDPVPLYIFDNQTNSPNLFSTPSTNNNHSKKGYSNLIFNSTRTKLYSNCMNNNLYEYNFLTYSQNHTRIINEILNKNMIKNYHTNQSNFIKSSLSQCNNFILTGSSDFNAYIYSTNINNNLVCYKKSMPVIVLKGHTNEVTTVDWNPFDSNQLVTCSDDNTIRLWNVKREMDTLDSKECNFLKSELIDEFKKQAENDAEHNNSNISDSDNLENFYNNIEKLEIEQNYITGIEFNNRIYNKYRPHSTGVYDDYLFIGYEHKKFMRKPKSIKNNIDFEDMDIEKELCLKCESINIDKVNTNLPASPTSSILNSIENDLKNKMETNFENENKFKNFNFRSLLSDLPINLLAEQEHTEEVVLQHNLNNNVITQSPKNHSQTVLASVFATLSQSQNKSKTKTIKRKIVKPRKSQNSPDETTLLSQTNMISNLTKTPTTSKKRSLNSTIKDDADTKIDSDQIKIPKTKKRLIMSDCITNQANLAQIKPTTSTSNNHTNGTRTILDYFSFKSQN